MNIKGKKIESVENLGKRDVDIDFFLANKGKSPTVKDYRRKAKFANFGMLFGGTVPGVCFNIVMPNWTPEECIEFIDDMDLEMPDYDKKNPKKDFRKLAMVVAEHIHSSFFNTYRGLLPWIEDCHKEAREFGYIRYLHGGRRLLPQLKYIGNDTDRKEVSGWENISVNSRVQNFEIVVVARSMILLHKALQDTGLSERNWIFGMIHDAIVTYVHKDDMAEVYKLIKDSMEKQYSEYEGISLTAEADIADFITEQEDNRSYWGSSPVWEGQSYEEMFPYNAV